MVPALLEQQVGVDAVSAPATHCWGPINPSLLMTRLLTLLCFCLATTAAQAQTTFSFSGLEWGDSPDQVAAKLTAANLPLVSRVEKLSCMVQSACTLRFEGAVIGAADFQTKKLVAVQIFSAQDAATDAERGVTLERRYGKPLPSQGSGRPFDDENLTSRWRSPSGETLLIGPGGFMSYRSGALNKVATDAAVRF